jgi:hypothetical protein
MKADAGFHFLLVPTALVFARQSGFLFYPTPSSFRQPLIASAVATHPTLITTIQKQSSTKRIIQRRRIAFVTREKTRSPSLCMCQSPFAKACSNVSPV